ncbi:MAG: hypothetical protein NVS3B20_07900 [Polyangiales bacterium]
MSDATAALWQPPSWIDDLGGAETFRLDHLHQIHNNEMHPLALLDGFGDGALLARITPLARARRALLERGYRFVPSQQLSAAGDLIPLLQLASILESKTIPYRRTTAALSQVIQQAPEMRLDDLMFRDVCAASHTFHEGAHALFYEEACAVEGVPHGGRLVEVLVASEAFAMALEAYAALVGRRRSTALFLAVGAYSDPFAYAKFEKARPGVLDRLALLATSYPVAVMRYLASAFLIANLRPKATEGKTGLALWLADYARLPVGHREDIGCMLAICLDMDPTFRGRTATTFFRYLGLERELLDLYAAPLEISFTSNSPFHVHLPRSIAILFEGDR